MSHFVAIAESRALCWGSPLYVGPTVELSFLASLSFIAENLPSFRANDLGGRFFLAIDW